MDPSTMYLTAFIIVGGIIFLVLFFHYVPFFLWLSAKVSGVNISLVQLFLMRIRNVPPYIIVPGLIEAHKAGLSNITRDELEAHYLAGGHVEKVVHALVSASKANIELPFQMATAIDLAGRDVFEAVQMSVNPKVIDTPPVTAVAKDGIQLIAKARVTVRANIRQLVGGAGEDTILARVGEGIVSSIGSSENHKSVLENPDSISKLVLRKGLDAGTAFEILSIDITNATKTQVTASIMPISNILFVRIDTSYHFCCSHFIQSPHSGQHTPHYGLSGRCQTDTRSTPKWAQT